MQTSRDDIFPLIWSSLSPAVIADLLTALDPVIKGRQLLLRCPACGHKEAWIYSREDGKGPNIHCNRKNNCGYQNSLWEYVKVELCGGDKTNAFNVLVEAAGIVVDRSTPPGEMGAARRFDARSARRERMDRAFGISAQEAPPPTPEERATQAEAIKRRVKTVQSIRGGPAFDYLLSRGIPEATICANKARYAPAWEHWQKTKDPQTGAEVWERNGTDQRVVWPVYNRSGQVVAISARAIEEEFHEPKVQTIGDRRLGIYSTVGALDGDVLTITEAPIDALSLAACGLPSIALLGTSWPSWLHQKTQFKTVLIALDNDTAGESAAAKLAAECREVGAKCYRLRPSGKDWNEDLQTLGVEAMTEALSRVLQSLGLLAWGDSNGMGCPNEVAAATVSIPDNSDPLLSVEKSAESAPFPPITPTEENDPELASLLSSAPDPDGEGLNDTPAAETTKNETAWGVPLGMGCPNEAPESYAAAKLGVEILDSRGETISPPLHSKNGDNLTPLTPTEEAETLIERLRGQGYLISLGDDDRVKVNTPDGRAIPGGIMAEMKPLRVEIKAALRLELRMTLYPTDPEEILSLFDRLGIVLLWREGEKGLSAFAPEDAIPSVELRELVKRLKR